MKKYILPLIISLLLVTSCSKIPRKPSLDEMIGQMLMVGFYGMEATPDTKIVKAIKEYHLGGVILFDYNAGEKSHNRNIRDKEQLTNLVKQLKSTSSTPLFVAIDQEGGLVSRLKEPYGFKKPRSAGAIGQINNPDSTRAWGELISNQLNETGINLNYAPVVDVAVNPDCPVIAKLHRSFSSDPLEVVEHSSILIDKHHDNGVLTAIKHFPGHGSSLSDSHNGFTDVTTTWSEKELIPFKELIKADKLDMIMTAHIFNKNIDSDYPATLSEKTINGLLRDKLGWSGVVVSDGLYMKAIHKNYSLETTIEKAVNAGVDILLFASPNADDNISRDAFTTLKQLVKSGKVSKSRIEESYRRIMALKERLPK